MSRIPFLVVPLAALLAVGTAAAGIGQASAKAPITRTERCFRMNRQLNEMLMTKAAAPQAAAARALQKNATRLCSHKKQAQGIRAFANALKLLGAKPIDADL